MRKSMFAVSALLFALSAAPAAMAASSGVYTRTVHQGMAVTMKALSRSLAMHHFKIVMKMDIGKKVAFAHRKLHFAHYNMNHLSDVRTIIFCNPVMFNALTNADPDMAAICPLHVTLTTKQGWTTIQYARAGYIAAGTPAEGVARRIESTVVSAINATK